MRDDTAPDLPSMELSLLMLTCRRSENGACQSIFILAAAGRVKKGQASRRALAD